MLCTGVKDPFTENPWWNRGISSLTFCFLNPETVEILFKKPRRIVKNLIEARSLQKTGSRTLKTTLTFSKSRNEVWGCWKNSKKTMKKSKKNFKFWVTSNFISRFWKSQSCFQCAGPCFLKRTGSKKVFHCVTTSTKSILHKSYRANDFCPLPITIPDDSDPHLRAQTFF